MRKHYKVHWNDAVSTDAWTPSGDIVPALALIETIGIFVKENEDVIVLALSYDTTNDNYSNFINIPKKWIVQRKLIKT